MVNQLIGYQHDGTYKSAVVSSRAGVDLNRAFLFAPDFEKKFRSNHASTFSFEDQDVTSRRVTFGSLSEFLTFSRSSAISIDSCSLLTNNIWEDFIVLRGNPRVDCHRVIEASPIDGKIISFARHIAGCNSLTCPASGAVITSDLNSSVEKAFLSHSRFIALRFPKFTCSLYRESVASLSLT